MVLCVCVLKWDLFRNWNNTDHVRLYVCGQFEQPEVRELKMILDGQNEIYRSLKSLLVKLDEVVGRQERELSLLTMISQGQTQASPSDHRQVVIKPGFHYPSWRAVLTGNGNRSPVNSGR